MWPCGVMVRVDEISVLQSRGASEVLCFEIFCSSFLIFEPQFLIDGAAWTAQRKILLIPLASYVGDDPPSMETG